MEGGGGGGFTEIARDNNIRKHTEYWDKNLLGKGVFAYNFSECPKSIGQGCTFLIHHECLGESDMTLPRTD